MDGYRTYWMWVDSAQANTVKAQYAMAIYAAIVD